MELMEKSVDLLKNLLRIFKKKCEIGTKDARVDLTNNNAGENVKNV